MEVKKKGSVLGSVEKVAVDLEFLEEKKKLSVVKEVPSEENQESVRVTQQKAEKVPKAEKSPKVPKEPKEPKQPKEKKPKAPKSVKPPVEPIIIDDAAPKEVNNENDNTENVIPVSQEQLDSQISSEKPSRKSGPRGPYKKKEKEVSQKSPISRPITDIFKVMNNDKGPL